MSVFKIEKNKNYTIMSNYHLRDKRLSYKAKGMLSFMLSLPDDWDYSINGLVSLSKEGIKAVKNILKELQDNGYLIISKNRNKLGQYEYEYLIYEEPECQKGEVDQGEVENDIQINTNIQSTNNKDDKYDKTNSSFFIPEEHNKLTLELINNNYIDEYDTDLCKYDDLFKRLLIDNSYTSLINRIHYITHRVVNRKFKDEDNNIIENKFGYFNNAIINNINKLNNMPDKLYSEYDVDSENNNEWLC